MFPVFCIFCFLISVFIFFYYIVVFSGTHCITWHFSYPAITFPQGAFWGLFAGLLIGVSRLSLDWVYPEPVCGSGVEDTRPALLAQVNYLHFAAVIGIITSAVVVVVSLGTTPIPKHQVGRSTETVPPSLLVVSRSSKSGEYTPHLTQSRMLSKT